MADETFGQALAGTYLPFVKMNNDQAMQQYQADRDYATQLFNQERQKATEKHYQDMDKRWAAQGELAAKTEADRVAQQGLVNRRLTFAGFTNEFDRLRKGGSPPDEAFSRALASQGITAKDAPPEMRDVVEDIWKTHQKTLPTALNSPGTPVMQPQPEQVPQPTAGIAAMGMTGGPAGGQQPFAQPPPQSQPIGASGGLQPNYLSQPSDAPFQPMPQTREQWGATNLDPQFLLAQQKQAAMIKSRNDALAIQRDRAQAYKDNIYSLKDDRTARDYALRANADSNTLLRKARADFLPELLKIKKFDNDTKRMIGEAIRDWKNVDAAAIGTRLQQKFMELDPTSQINLKRQADAAEANYRDISTHVGALVKQRDALIEKKSSLMEGRNFPQGDSEEDIRAQRAITDPIDQALQSIDIQLNGSVSPSVTGVGLERDPTTGLNYLMNEALKLRTMIPTRSETKSSGDFKVPPAVEGAMQRPFQPNSITPTQGPLAGKAIHMPSGQVPHPKTIEEAMKLPKGTFFITPDGRSKVR